MRQWKSLALPRCFVLVVYYIFRSAMLILCADISGEIPSASNGDNILPAAVCFGNIWNDLELFLREFEHDDNGHQVPDMCDFALPSSAYCPVLFFQDFSRLEKAAWCCLPVE